ncbi:hypothetical protein [Rickettsia endosymbiont of Polydrusus tereticollis]
MTYSTFLEPHSNNTPPLARMNRIRFNLSTQQSNTSLPESKVLL